MNYLNHIPWDIASLAAIVVVLAILLYFIVGKKVGIHVWKSSAETSVQQMGKPLSAPIIPPPLPVHAALPLEPTQYLMPDLGSEGAASVARAAELEAGFAPEALLKEIEKCYRAVLEAYDEKKLEKLQTLLGAEAFEAFKKELMAREESKEELFSHLKAVESLKLVHFYFPPEMPVKEAQADWKKRVEVEIASWQVNGVKEASGHLVFGTQGLTHFSEKWLFEAGDSSEWRAVAIEAI